MIEPTVSTERIYEGKILNLRIDTVKLPNGETARREIVEHRNAVAIVAVDAKGDVLLVRQYRKAIERELLEVPAGVMNPGEEPLDCADRELREETGFSAGNLERLGSFYTSPGFSSELMHVYLAKELRESPLTPDEDELIKVEPMPWRDIEGLVEAGEIADAKSIAGLLLAMRKLATEREARG